MTENPTDIFKAVATPSPELQQMLAYHADNGSVLTGVKPRPVKDQQKDANRDDMASNIVMQHLSEQERIHQEYREETERINQAIELALADAQTPEERQEILNYQNDLQSMREEIEAKRSAGIDVTEDEKAYLEQLEKNMPESVRTNLPDSQPNVPVEVSANELEQLSALSGTSVASASDNSTPSKASDMNQSFSAAASNESGTSNMPADPGNAPDNPVDTPKFTI